MDVMLSDNTRRFLCRAGFLVACALPTLFCLQLILFPKTTADWSDQFQRCFGVINRIGQVRALAPGHIQMQDLEIGADRFHSRLRMDRASLQLQGSEQILHVANAEGSAAAFWNTLHRIVETVAWSDGPQPAMRIRFDAVKFLESELPDAVTRSWRDMDIAIGPMGQRISVSFLPDQKSDQFIAGRSLVTLRRTMQGEQAIWQLDASGFQIPGWVLHPLVAPTTALNRNAELVDIRALLVHRQGRWSGEMQGQLLDVELNHLVGGRFGSTMDGRASINLQAVRLVNNRIESLKGDLSSPSGLVSSRLLHASHHALGMQLVEPYGQSMFEKYTDLRLGFRIEKDQLAVFGMESGSLLNDPAGHSMLIAQQGQQWPVASLITLMSWPLQQVSPNTAALARHLVISPLDGWDSLGKTERTALYEEVGQDTYFNRQVR